MKRVILSVLVAGSLLATSCKEAKKEVEKVEEKTEVVVKEATKTVEETVDKVAAEVESALEGVSIPAFKDPKVGEHLQAYATYAKDYIAAKGDVVKNAELAKKGVELATKGKEILGSLDEEGAKKFKSVMNAIQSKMAPSK